MNELKRVLLMCVAVLWGQLALADEPVVIDLQVTGMTCPFCVYSVRKSLEQLPGVDSAEVSLDDERARITLKDGAQVDIPAIHKAIVDAGFTPGKLVAGRHQGSE